MTPHVADGVAVRLPSDPKYLPLLRAVVDQGAALAGITSLDRDRVLLALTEAVTNVIRHVYKDRPDQPIELSVRATPGSLSLELTDFGRFVDPAKICSRPLDEVRPGGLGVHLIRSTMDVVEYKQNGHGGTTLTLVKHVSAGDASNT
jgi:anti-sigma regulatory factor (Ser/Thr protein kinase)